MQSVLLQAAAKQDPNQPRARKDRAHHQPAVSDAIVRAVPAPRNDLTNISLGKGPFVLHSGDLRTVTVPRDAQPCFKFLLQIE